MKCSLDSFRILSLNFFITTFCQASYASFILSEQDDCIKMHRNQYKKSYSLNIFEFQVKRLAMHLLSCQNKIFFLDLGSDPHLQEKKNIHVFFLFLPNRDKRFKKMIMTCGTKSG